MSNRRKTRTKWLKASTVLLVGAFLVTIGWQNRLSLSFAVGAAMIAWAGILAYQHGLSTPVEKSFVRLKWRLDQVYAPWVGG